MRSIPSMVDGFKPTQRKIMFCAFKRNLQSDVKVAQLAGYIAEHSAYHHGEVSLQGTIVAMAQSFVGSNNINLLVPSGQFGTRLMGGKDSASSRYIFANLRRSLNGQEMVEMHPWYRGYKGEIKPSDKGGYEVYGIAEKIDDTTVSITELAIRKWTQTYKEWLQELYQDQQDQLDEKKKHPFCIEGMKEYHTENTVHFHITLSAAHMAT